MGSVIVSLLFTLRASLRDRAALQLEILASTSAPGPGTDTPPTRAAHPIRPSALALAVRRVARMAGGGRHRQARDRGLLASAGLPLALDLEESAPWGQPAVPSHVRTLIRTMSDMNPLWGAPRIHGELSKLGIDVCEATVAKYMARRQRPPSQAWRTFLANHIDQIAAADFFVVPTFTYRLLFVLVILTHRRRRIAHLAVTAHPTAAWTAQQLREAFPEDTAPRYLIHDRDHAFAALAATASGMGTEELRTRRSFPVAERVYRAPDRLLPT